MTLSCEQWGLLKRHGMLQGRHLYDLGFWNLLQHFLSSEAFLLVHDALGYESIFANWNAAEAIPWFLADFGVGYFTLEDGMGTVPEALATVLDAARSQWRFLGHKLLRVTWEQQHSDAPFRLEFEGIGDHVSARTLILALPKKSLKNINVTLRYSRPLATDPVVRFQERIDEVTSHALFKMFLAYDRAWWEDHRALGAESGRSTTDLPIRQVYYYPAARATQPGGSRGIVMASYSDEHYVNFWQPMMRKKGKPPAYRREQDQFDEVQEAIIEQFGVSEPMLLKAHRQVAALHPELRDADGIPAPCAGIVMDWSDPELSYGGGWHSWNVHSKSWEIVEYLAKPFDGVPLFVCGEAFSTEKGWIEGALKSAEVALERLGLPAPDVDDQMYRDARSSGYTSYVHT